MLFAVICTDKPGRAEVRAANRDAHLAFLTALGDAVILGGPMIDDAGGMVGSIIVVEADNRADVEATFAEDPYFKAGLFESVVIRAYKKVFPK